jgi:hypothetical protein
LSEKPLGKGLNKAAIWCKIEVQDERTASLLSPLNADPGLGTIRQIAVSRGHEFFGQQAERSQRSYAPR